MKRYILGTRGSKLALAQAKEYLKEVKRLNPEVAFEIKVIESKGDTEANRPLTSFESPGVFSSALEEALKNKEIDFAVHSLKDLPANLPDGLRLINLAPKRADYHDLLLYESQKNPEELERIGTSSLRRTAELKRLFPKTEVLPIRGNIDTRIRKLKNKEYDGIILAKAAVDRLGINLESEGLEAKLLDFIPAPTQGILGIEIREEDTELNEILSKAGDEATQLALETERKITRALGADCKDIIGIHLGKAGENYWIEGLFGENRVETPIIKKEEIEYWNLWTTQKLKEMKLPGKVYLVGAGPGPKKYLTLAALEEIKKADCIIYDALIGEEIPDLFPQTAEKIYVGKRAGKHSYSQEEINKLLVKKAREYKRVVRLKGGDPFVFGRAGEEMEALVGEGISFEVTPGISSAIAAPAAYDIPVTDRRYSSAFAVISGHLKAGNHRPKLNFKNLADFDGTLIFLMSVGNLKYITRGLIRYGKNPRTPTAIIQKAFMEGQALYRQPLAEVEKLVDQVEPPAIFMVGKVVDFPEYLLSQSLRNLPSVLVTRPEDRGFIEALTERGVYPVTHPVSHYLEDEEIKKRLKEKLLEGDYDSLLFSSVTGVKIVADLLNKEEMDFSGKTFLGNGKKTLKEIQKIDQNLENHHYEPHIDLEALHERYGDILYIHSADTPVSNISGVKEYTPYKTESLGGRLYTPVDALSFFSAKTIDYFLRENQIKPYEDTPVFVIGEKTAVHARESGFKKVITADEKTAESVADSIADYFSKRNEK